MITFFKNQDKILLADFIYGLNQQENTLEQFKSMMLMGKGF